MVGWVEGRVRVVGILLGCCWSEVNNNVYRT